MEHNAAAENLQVIRTLMERAALYRRTLAPILLYVGGVGALTSVAGLAFGIGTVRSVCGWWLGAAVVATVGAFAIARRQAVGDREPFWSPPAVHAAQAIAPPLTGGLLLSVAFLVFAPASSPLGFVMTTTLFYGCAVHAAGFFMPRGLKRFAWLIIAATLGTLFGLFLLGFDGPGPKFAHGFMGLVFGALHLAYGGYLYLTDSRKTAL